MAVPKQRQSHSRTNKRRSQHKAPRRRCTVPALPRAQASASGLPECGTYAGRDVVVQQPTPTKR